MSKNKYLFVDYEMLSKQKRELDLDITINNLSELHNSITDTPHTFSCSFSFFEENSTPTIKYHITSNLELICQDSLEHFSFKIDTLNTMAIVEDDRLLKNDIYEPFICKERTLDLREIIKEEVILALPIAPKKETNSCNMDKKHSYYTKIDDSPKTKKENPFEILKSLTKN